MNCLSQSQTFSCKWNHTFWKSIHLSKFSFNDIWDVKIIGKIFLNENNQNAYIGQGIRDVYSELLNTVW